MELEIILGIFKVEKTLVKEVIIFLNFELNYIVGVNKGDSLIVINCVISFF